MSFQHVVTKSVQAPGGTLSQTLTFSSATSVALDEAVPTPSTNQEYDVSFKVAKIKSFYLVCDQAVTVKTNSSGAPDNTFSLLAGQPLEWQVGSYYTNLVTADVTKLYVTNASGVIANLSLRVLLDPTP